MMRTIEKLLKAEKSTKAGNHAAIIDGMKRTFKYYWTAICSVDDEACTYHLDNGGYGTSITTRAINDYRRYFNDLGYTEV